MAKTATLGWLAGIEGAQLHFACPRRVLVGDEGHELHQLSRRYGMTVSAVEACARWGAATTIADLERRGRCQVCGVKGARIDNSAPLNPERVRAEIGV